MFDIYKLYKDFERDDNIFAFKGPVTQELLSSVYQIIESNLENGQEEGRRKKRFYHVLVECLQNVFHHSEKENNDAVNPYGSVIFMIGRTKENIYRIVTGNFIAGSNCDELKTKIDKVNNMNADELQAHYLDKLNTTQFSEKGGAGLGIIDIARKSGHKLEYSFQKVSDEYSFFTLTVLVK